MFAAEGSDPLIPVDSDTEFAVVAAAGRRFGPVEDGFDVEKAVDMDVTAAEVVAVAVARKTAWRPRSLSGHLERCCFEQERNLECQWPSMTGAAGWMAEESHLEIKQQRCSIIKEQQKRKLIDYKPGEHFICFKISARASRLNILLFLLFLVISTAQFLGIALQQVTSRSRVVRRS